MVKCFMRLSLDTKRLILCLCTLLYGLLLCVRWVVQIVLPVYPLSASLWLGVGGLLVWLATLAVLFYFWFRAFASEVMDVSPRSVTVICVTLVGSVSLLIVVSLILVTVTQVLYSNQPSGLDAVPVLVILVGQLLLCCGVLYLSIRISHFFYGQYRENGRKGRLGFAVMMLGSNIVLTLASLGQLAAEAYHEYLSGPGRSVPSLLRVFIFGVLVLLESLPVLLLVLFAAVQGKMQEHNAAGLNVPLLSEVPALYSEI
jgi:hypothetical protein